MTATLSRPDTGRGDVTQLRVILSEWIKFRSLRSTWVSFAAALAIAVGLGTLFSAIRASRIAGLVGAERAHFDPTLISLRGMFVAQLAVGVLAVLVVTGEYSTGMIRATLAAVPRRLPVLYAKAVVFSATAFIIMLVAAIAAFLLGQQRLATVGIQATFSTPGAARAVIGAALYLTVLGLFALGLGFLLRNTAGAIATLFGALLVLPLLAQALPDPWSGDVNKYLPMIAGSQIITVKQDPGMLRPWAGLGIFALYALAALIAGAITLHRRDS